MDKKILVMALTNYNTDPWPENLCLEEETNKPNINKPNMNFYQSKIHRKKKGGKVNFK